MSFNKLLQKQIRKYLPEGSLDEEHIMQFVQAVNDSYEAYERDRVLSNHAFTISEQEYRQINEKLTKEIILKKASILQLKEAISNVEDLEAIEDDTNDDLSYVVNYLQKQLSEKKKSEILVKQSEKRMRLALQTIEDNVWEYDFPSRKMIFAQTETSILKLDRPEYVGEENQEWWKSIYEEDMKVATDIFRKYNKGEISKHSIEYRMYCRDGSLKWVLNRGAIIQRDNNGRTVKVIGSLTDIDKLKTVQGELTATANRLSNLLINMQTGVLVEDEHERIVLTNKKFCELFSVTVPPEQLTGLDYSQAAEEYMHLFKDPQKFVEGIHTLLRERKLVADEEMEMADGRILERSYIPLFVDGQYKGHLWKYNDITAKKRAEEKILQSELRLRTALEKIGDNVWEHNFVTGETYFSNTQNRLLGFAEDEYANNPELWLDRIHPDDKKILENNDRLYREGKIDHHLLEYRLLHKNNAVKWILDRGVVIERKMDGTALRVIGTHTDITQRKLAEQAIALSEEKYRSIIANMNLGLLEVDVDENIHYTNHSFCEMSGYAEEELLNRKASLLFAKGENSEILETKNEMRRKGVSDAYEMAVKNKRGQLKWWLISGAPRYNDKGELVGSIGIHLDITDQKQLELDLVDAREAAEQSARAKEVFLTNMSHEIRTPMNAILGMSRQLVSTPLNDKQKFYLNTVNTAGEHLLVVINDILDISKIEAGKMQLEKIGFRPTEAIKHCTLVMMHRAEEKGLHLLFEVDKKIDAVLIGDPYRLNQVLLNLLSNAIKFTEKGSVTISCKVQSEEPGRQWVSIMVDDTGIGMDKEFLTTIFQKFTQEDKTTVRKFGGTGLGMSICKQLVELMDGSISIQSKKNKGTSVELVIPFFTGTEKDIPSQVRHHTDSSILQDKKILLVEDNEMNRLVANTVMKKYGADITEVVNGKEAIDELKLRAYDLVLMDVQMPVMDGLEATRIMRRELKTKIPVIALTANAIKGENQLCLEAGMNDYISKPFQEDDLIGAIAHWLGHSINEGKIPAMENREAEPLYDLSKLVKISGGNKEFVTKMTHLFAEQTPASVKEIRAAYQKDDFATIKSLAHRIRPGIDNMGIGILYQDVRDIELLATEEPRSPRLEGLIIKLEDVIDKVVGQLKAM